MIKKIIPIVLCPLQFFSLSYTEVIQKTAIPYQDFYATIEFAKEEAQDFAQSYERFLKGTYLHATGKLEKALKTLQPMVTRNASPHVYEAFIRLLFDRGNFFAIANLTTQKQALFDKIFENNLEIKLLIAQSLLHAGNDNKAEQMFTQLAETYPDNEQVAYYTAVSFIKKQEYQQALDFLNEALERKTLKSKHFLFLFLKSKVHMMMNQFPPALQAIEASLKLFPKFDKGWLFKAMLLEQQGNVHEAINGYERFLGIVGRDVNVEKQLIQLLFSQQQFAKASHYLKKIQSNSPEYFFDIALIELKAKNYAEALTYIDKAIAQKHDFEKAKFLKIEILLSLKQPQQSVDFLKDWILQEPNNTNLLQTLLLLRKAQVQVPTLITALETVVNAGKPTLGILALLGDLCQEVKQFEKGITYYKQAADTAPDNKLKSQAFFHLGYLYFLTKQADKLVETLNQAISLEPAYPSAYNLLAYYYAQENKNLDHALTLAQKALEKKPECSYYLDTKGTVLLKLGRKQESQVVFKKALQLAPHDKIIQEHLKQAQL